MVDYSGLINLKGLIVNDEEARAAALQTVADHGRTMSELAERSREVSQEFADAWRAGRPAPVDDLDRMLADLAALGELPPIDQIRRLRHLAAEAPGILSRRADAVTERLAGPGRQMTITGLAAELGVSRNTVSEAVSRAREARNG